MRIASSKSGRDRTPFIGRLREQSDLRATLRQGTSLVTLTGPSGIGKTRLARKVAGDLSESFNKEGGTWFCSLAECRAPADLEATVAWTLGIHQQHGDELARSIAIRGPLLLLLDNADPIAGQMEGVLNRWLERCVELQMIVTSLVPTGAHGEAVHELRPLAPDDAVALYQDRAHRAWADRSLSDDETSEVQELIQRLDRLPLAIELAAARVRILPPRTMLSMLEKRFDLLRSAPPNHGPTAPPHRRSSLIGALELTWSHLGHDEQLALARAAVFEGGFTEEAASAIVEEGAADGEAAHDASCGAVVETLDDLYRKSLLSHDEADSDRYFLLESVKEYALHQLHRMGRWDEAIRRHANFYLSRFRPRPVWDHEVGSQSLHRLKNERENLIAIHQRFLVSDPSLAARAGIALSPLLLSEGHPTSESQITLAALEAARRSGDSDLILAALEPVYFTHMRHGRFDDAMAAMLELVELSRASGEKAVEAYTLSRIAMLHLREVSDFSSSGPLLERAVQLSREVGLPQLEGAILLVRGLEAFERKAMEEAESHLLRSVDCLRDHGHPGSDMNSINGLCAVLDSQGKHLEVRRLMQEVIERSRHLGQGYYEAAFLSNLARMELNAGFLDHAEAAARQSLAIRREQGNRFLERIILYYLGIVSLEHGDLKRAAEWLAEAEELQADLHGGESRAELPIFLAILEAKRGQIDEAARLLDEARASPLPRPMGSDPRFIDGVESLLEVIAVRHLAEEAREGTQEKIARARARLAALPSKSTGWQDYSPVLRRLLENELLDLDAGSPPPTGISRQPTLVVGQRHDWFRLPGDPVVDLRNRPVMQRMFGALMKARLEEPGVAIDPFVLIELGWPGMEMNAVNAFKRLHMAIMTLRNLGLRTIVLTNESGYLLDPAVAVRADDEVPAR